MNETDNIDSSEMESVNPHDSHNCIEDYKGINNSESLAKSPSFRARNNTENQDLLIDHNKLTDAPDKKKRKFYEQMKSNKDQYNTELLKGLDKKNSDLKVPCQFCPDSNMEGSTTIIAPRVQIHNVITKNLNKKYLTSRDYYNSKVITDIIYNENTNLVSVFKDYLIYDDISEFLKRYYYMDEFPTRLPKIYEFYEKYSKVFPNYVNIPENKYMFKNIERKQKLIDDKQKAIDQMKRIREKENKEKHHFSDLLEDSTEMMFSTKFMESIIKQDHELEEIRKKRQANERLMQAINAINNNDSVMDAFNSSNVTGDISMSVMENKENSDLS